MDSRLWENHSVPRHWHTWTKENFLGHSCTFHGISAGFLYPLSKQSACGLLPNASAILGAWLRLFVISGIGNKRQRFSLHQASTTFIDSIFTYWRNVRSHWLRSGFHGRHSSANSHIDSLPEQRQSGVYLIHSETSSIYWQNLLLSISLALEHSSLKSMDGWR